MGILKHLQRSLMSAGGVCFEVELSLCLHVWVTYSGGAECVQLQVVISLSGCRAFRLANLVFVFSGIKIFHATPPQPRTDWFSLSSISHKDFLLYCSQLYCHYFLYCTSESFHFGLQEKRRSIVKRWRVSIQFWCKTTGGDFHSRPAVMQVSGSTGL